MTNISTNFINNEWTSATGGETFMRESPHDTGDIVGTYGQASEADVDAAVQAAKTAFKTWSRLAQGERGTYLTKLADAIAARADEIARAVVREMGKTLVEAKGEVARAVVITRYYAGDALMPVGDVIPSANPNTHFYSMRLPIGVAGLVTPWNFPIAIPIWKAAPALVYGNTVVLKPSEMAPQTAHLLAECVAAAGLPHGVFNVVQGGGATGKALVAHKDVTLISFTGSAKTGRAIAQECAGRGAKYQLEMGGKNPVIVLGDANLELAATLVLQGAFKMAGQKCTATARVIVTEDIYDTFVPMLVARAKTLTVGDPMADGIYSGPVINAASVERVTKYAADAVSSGAAQLLCGGERATTSGLENGHYVQPTILAVASPDAPIAQEEVFGPVLVVLKAASFDEALAIANGVGYGLSASCFTTNLHSAMRFAREIEAGLVRINGETAGVEPQAPFGGTKGSSSFSREQGQAAREFYTQMKTVAFEAGV